MEILKKFSKIDRRIVYLLLALAVIIPMIVSFNVRFYVDQSSQSLFDAVDRVPPNGRPVLLVFDYDPQIMPELDPMAIAILRHCFARNIRVVGMTTGAQGAALGERAMTKVAAEYDKKIGHDYCYFGYKIPLSMLYIGENAKKALPVDHYDRPFDSLPMMRGIRNYDDIPLVVDLAGSSILNNWIVYAGARYHVKLGAGVTAVMAPDFYQFLQTGQLVGQLSGMKGAAEYEQLIVDHGITKSKGLASRAMNAISISHLLLIALIILGNIGYFAARSGKKKNL
jgi:hypothetical protein